MPISPAPVLLLSFLHPTTSPPWPSWPHYPLLINSSFPSQPKQVGASLGEPASVPASVPAREQGMDLPRANAAGSGQQVAGAACSCSQACAG